mmetsp:Transcript_8657/g.29716  ORF Transcript_8657/g.29716 Transcript_8657/m.29716 type:complete len:227 (-) Transcript_8657:815-1495(-)
MWARSKSVVETSSASSSARSQFFRSTCISSAALGSLDLKKYDSATSTTLPSPGLAEPSPKMSSAWPARRCLSSRCLNLVRAEALLESPAILYPKMARSMSRVSRACEASAIHIPLSMDSSAISLASSAWHSARCWSNSCLTSLSCLFALAEVEIVIPPPFLPPSTCCRLYLAMMCLCVSSRTLSRFTEPVRKIRKPLDSNSGLPGRLLRACIPASFTSDPEVDVGT